MQWLSYLIHVCDAAGSYFPLPPLPSHNWNKQTVSMTASFIYKVDAVDRGHRGLEFVFFSGANGVRSVMGFAHIDRSSSKGYIKTNVHHTCFKFTPCTWEHMIKCLKRDRQLRHWSRILHCYVSHDIRSTFLHAFHCML